MNYKKIQQILSSEKPFRVKQANRAIFFDLVEDWNEVTTLSKELRDKLAKECPLDINSKVLIAKDNNSAKAVLTYDDGAQIETVLMKHDNKRNTVCVSSQVGCQLGCAFCATGSGGFFRDLTAEEIVLQILLFSRFLKKSDEKVTNVVFMGMGEPFMNYDEVMKAVRLINDNDKFNIGARHISVSTVGVVPGIEKFSEEDLQVNLAISLHAPDNDLRDKIMPINKKYPLEKVLAAASDYIKKTNRKLMIEYVMLKNINDSEDQARALASLLNKKLKHLFFVNLIAYNPTGKFEPSSLVKIKKFKDVLMQAGITTLERYRFGRDIKAACGQLVKRKVEPAFAEAMAGKEKFRKNEKG
jgi:23S rRNA (adenine2503-C2)-methyltransferase